MQQKEQMFQFIQKLYDSRHRNLKLILLDDTRPGEDNSYAIKPNRLFALFAFVCLLISSIVVLIFMLTPLGSLLYTTEDANMRAQVEDVTRRVIALQDSLTVRDNQLTEMKNIIKLSLDTTLTMDDRFTALFNVQDDDGDFVTINLDESSTSEKIGDTGIVFANMLKSAPDFPAMYPVKGTLTREYEPDDQHFGIDVATKENEIITSIADGTIVNASWTISDGYVISIQHEGGILSLYKHCSLLSKKNGDVVLKGDIIGTTGDVGVSSSGPHLHFEIWKDGLPQDPAMYLIQ